MTKTMNLTEIEQLAFNHRQHRDLPSMTNAVFIDIKEFQAFLSEAQASHPDCDTLQVNFIRYELAKDEYWISAAGNNLSQVSLQMFPVKAADKLNWKVNNPAGVDVVTFAVCPPGPDYKEKISGICPPKGSCSEQSTDALQPGVG